MDDSHSDCYYFLFSYYIPIHPSDMLSCNSIGNMLLIQAIYNYRKWKNETCK